MQASQRKNPFAPIQVILPRSVAAATLATSVDFPTYLAAVDLRSDRRCPAFAC